MKFIPAIDLKDNKCVRLQKGKVFEDNDYSKSKFELTTEIKFK